ncbi:MAG TPA: short-chain dehydrogenase [Alcaligenaceae bacterium]|nr:short-chain dehydrogenase [Alcaligenaceae bacterium]
MTNKLTILSGTTRGLGAAMAAQLISNPGHLVTLSRKPSESLAQLAHEHRKQLTQIEVDLSVTADVERAAEQVKDLIGKQDSLRVIHNAGVVTPIAQAQNFKDLHKINTAFQINITAPIFLTAHILSASAHIHDRRIMLISSGAGRSPTSGWGVYCATKAAMDRYAECAQLDLADSARIVSMAPGLVDTPMQAVIRSSDIAEFPALERFVGFHQQHQLVSPEDVAKRLLTVFESEAFGAKTIDDIRQHTF